MEFNTFDIICGIILIIAAIRGFFKGFFHEALSFAGYFIGLWVAIAFSDDVANFLSDTLSLGPKYSSFIAFILILIAIILLVRLIAAMLTKLVDTLQLGLLNKLGGMIFSLGKMALILSIVLNMLAYVDQQEKLITKKTKEKSICYKPIESIVPKIMPLLGKHDYFAS